MQHYPAPATSQMAVSLSIGKTYVYTIAILVLADVVQT
jgi:hypothetical protein